VRWRGIEIAGGLALVGVLVLLLVTFLPESQSTTAVVSGSSGDSILGTETTTPAASPDPTAPPQETPTPEDEVSETPAKPVGIPVERRAGIAVQVLNAGAADGAAALTTGALAEQSFDPREPADAVAEAPGTRVLYAQDRRRAALTIGQIAGAERSQVVRAVADDPNWAAYGQDLDVLVIVGPPLP
jgi:hypothetical protein